MATRKRPVISVVSEAQQNLFSSVSSPPDPRVSNKSRGELIFNRPKPKYIVIGDQLLETHLREAGEDFCFVTRMVLGKLDWSDYESAYLPGGRRPYHPQLMLGIILYGIAKGVTSLRGLERLARLDLGCMWVSGGACPDHSALCRFLNKHAELLTDDFFTALTREVLSITKSDCSSVAGDGTVIQAAASRFGTVKREAAEYARRQAQDALREQPDDPKKKKKAEQANKVMSTIEERAKTRKDKGRKPEDTRVSRTEPESMTQPLKTGGVAPSYKQSVLANDKRVIVGLDVDASNEVSVVPTMINQAEKIGGTTPKQAMFDANYHADCILEMSIEKDIDVLIPKGSTNKDGSAAAKKSRQKYPKSDFFYNEITDTYICPAGATLTRRKNRSAKTHVEYATSECRTCHLRDKCTTRESGRRIRREKGDELREAMNLVMQQPGAQKQYCQRQAMVEPVFAEIKHIQGLLRFRRKGLSAVRLESYLHACAHNLRRAAAALSAAMGYFTLWVIFGAHKKRRLA